MKKKIFVGEFVHNELMKRARRKKLQGTPYADILENVKKKFPNGKTTLANIYWYSAKLKKLGYDLPERARANK